MQRGRRESSNFAFSTLTLAYRVPNAINISGMIFELRFTRATHLLNFRLTLNTLYMKLVALYSIWSMFNILSDVIKGAVITNELRW